MVYELWRRVYDSWWLMILRLTIKAIRLSIDDWLLFLLVYDLCVFDIFVIVSVSVFFAVSPLLLSVSMFKV